MLKNGKWICYPIDPGEQVVLYKKEFVLNKEIKEAFLEITALGVYEANINGERVGDFILAPGVTATKRVQVQIYDVANLLKNGNNIIEIYLGNGWFRGGMNQKNKLNYPSKYQSVIAELTVLYANGQEEIFYTNESWKTALSKIRFADIYNGESFDNLYKE